jgi:hypothetical protein
MGIVFHKEPSVGKRVNWRWVPGLVRGSVEKDEGEKRQKRGKTKVGGRQECRKRTNQGPMTPLFEV